MRGASRSSPEWTSTICLGCNGQWRQRACAVCGRHCAVRNADDRVGACELTEWQAVEQWAGDGASQKPRPSSTQGSVEVLWVSNAGASIGTATLMAKQQSQTRRCNEQTQPPPRAVDANLDTQLGKSRAKASRGKQDCPLRLTACLRVRPALGHWTEEGWAECFVTVQSH